MAQDERETAIHEAAHAVIAHYYGGHVTVVRLATDVADGEFKADLRGASATRIGKLLITLAGAAAQIKLVPSASNRGRYHRDWSHEKADRDLDGIFIELHGRRAGPCERRDIERSADCKLDRLLSDPAVWAAICAAAKELAAVKTLDGDHFRAIVEPHLSNVERSIGKEATLDDGRPAS